jgi:dTDP-4-amino-4,6-dideoxygalactose transaminase
VKRASVHETAAGSIPLMRPLLPDAQALLPYLRRIDERRHYTNFGPLVEELRDRLERAQGQLDGKTVHGVLTGNATQGLELALAAMDLPPSSKVVIPALTFPASATAVQRCGHLPVAADVDTHTWLLTPDQLPEQPKRQGIAAVMPVSAFGMPQDAQAWSEWSARTGVLVLIDAAAAFGAQKTAPGVMAVFSLHATKALSCGEGGLVVTRDAKQAQRLRAMTNFGIGLAHTSLASNAKMSEYHAAIGLAHLAMWSEQVQARRRVLERYSHALGPVLGTRLQLQQDTGLHAPSVLPVRLESGALRDRLEHQCQAQGVQTRRWYQPLIHQHPALGPLELLSPLVVAPSLAETLLGLPFFPDLCDADMDRVVALVREVVNGPMRT